MFELITKKKKKNADWWPSRLGGKLSYTLSWSLTLLIGLLTHHLDLFYLRKRWKGRDPGDDDVEWERKSKLILSLASARGSS